MTFYSAGYNGANELTPAFLKPSSSVHNPLATGKREMSALVKDGILQDTSKMRNVVSVYNNIQGMGQAEIGSSQMLEDQLPDLGEKQKQKPLNKEAVLTGMGESSKTKVSSEEGTSQTVGSEKAMTLCENPVKVSKEEISVLKRKGKKPGNAKRRKTKYAIVD